MVTCNPEIHLTSLVEVLFFDMEKWKRHYDLQDVQSVVADPSRKAFTGTAAKGGNDLGLTELEMRRVILDLKQGHFHKSMSTDHDNHYWQDVYYSKTPSGDDVYIELTLYTDGRPVVISFKRP